MKITKSKRIDMTIDVHAIDFSVAATDAELAEVGLFRSLREADIAREAIERENEFRVMQNCTDDECSCDLHSNGRRSIRDMLANKGLRSSSVNRQTEEAFWHGVRNLVRARKLTEAFSAIEGRAWEFGGVTINVEPERSVA